MPEFGIKHLLRVVGDEMLSGEPILRLASLAGDGNTVEEISVNDDLLFLIPGIEGKFCNYLLITNGMACLAGTRGISPYSQSFTK